MQLNAFQLTSSRWLRSGTRHAVCLHNCDCRRIPNHSGRPALLSAAQVVLKDTKTGITKDSVSNDGGRGSVFRIGEWRVEIT